MHQLLRQRGYSAPELYCLADKVQLKYERPYKEEKEPENQSAVNTIRILVDGQPRPIGQHLPRLRAIVAPAADRIVYYVPKEVRREAAALSKKLRDSRGGGAHRN